MQKDLVLELCVNDAQKARVKASYVAAEKTGKASRFEKATSEEEAKRMIEDMVSEYELYKAKEEVLKKLYNKIKTCVSIGVSPDQIESSLDKLVSEKKEEYNKNIQEKIAKLQAKLL